MSSKAEKRAKFEHVFGVIRDELVEYFKAQGMPQDATEWYIKVRAPPLRRAPRSRVRRTWTTTPRAGSSTAGCPSWTASRSCAGAR